MFLFSLVLTQRGALYTLFNILYFGKLPILIYAKREKGMEGRKGRRKVRKTEKEEGKEEMIEIEYIYLILHTNKNMESTHEIINSDYLSVEGLMLFFLFTFLHFLNSL